MQRCVLSTSAMSEIAACSPSSIPEDPSVFCLSVGASGEESACQCRRKKEMWVLSLDWEDPPGVGNGTPHQYSHLENPMDRGAWWATVHGVVKSQTWLSN